MKTATDQISKLRANHHRALERLYTRSELRSGLQIWRALRKIECDANRLATNYCNGETGYMQQGRTRYEFHFEHNAIQAWENAVSIITGRVERLLGLVPLGFYVNGDPRGYALKINPEEGKVPEGMHTDWGRYGILAPEIN